MRARAMVMMAANGGQSQHQNIIINTGNESVMMAPAVVTAALDSIKEQAELHTAGSMMRACSIEMTAAMVVLNHKTKE